MYSQQFGIYTVQKHDHSPHCVSGVHKNEYMWMPCESIHSILKR
ncbi:MAG: hypothetical protein IKR54_00865 [Lachnospiraceae bacterium]|nr:hypothetical protein [Lachnospiraceae bacterium]